MTATNDLSTHRPAQDRHPATFLELLARFEFRLVGPQTRPGSDNRFHIRRSDGSVATLLESEWFRVEVTNCGLPHAEPSLIAALARVSGIPKMSTMMIGAVLNAASRTMASEKMFVNVGVWNGFSLLAAMVGNSDKAILGIDNFSQFGGPKDEFLGRFFAARSYCHRFFDEDYLDFFARGPDRPIGVYFYDGEHSYKNQRMALEVAEEFFAEDCIVVVDDTNLVAPRQATLDFMEASERDYATVLDVQTSGEHQTLWNGLLVVQAGATEDLLLELAAPTDVEFVDDPTRPTDDLPPVTLIGFGSEWIDRPVFPSFDYPALEAYIVDPRAEPAATAGDAAYVTSVQAAIEQSQGQLIALVNLAGDPPPESAVAEAVSRTVRGHPALPFRRRNVGGMHG